MRAPAIAIVLCLWVNTLVQIDSLENQALTLVKRTSASELDSVLPNIPLVSWFNQIVGPRAGVIWQLSECGGEAALASKGDASDLPACLEANATLPDGHKVVMGILIGTFKKGLASKAAFNFGVVEYEEQLRPAKKLSDLPRLLSHQPPGKNQVILPDSVVDLTRIKWLPQPIPLPLPLGFFSKDWMTAELDPGQASSQAEDVPPPPGRLQSSSSSLNQPQSIQQLVDKVLEGKVISKVEAVYPPTARMMGAFGTVRVQVTVSETGQVIEATAVSGHKALRPAAVEAALMWVFKPTTVNGVPVKVQGILSFNFKSRP